MMSFKKKTIFTAVLMLVAMMMVLASGCQSAAPVSGNNASVGVSTNSSTTLDSAKAMAYAPNDQNAAANGISVSGQGTIMVKPDVAYITLGVQTTDADQLKARQANDEAMAKVFAAIKGFGITDDDITTTNFNISFQYDKDNVNVTGYTVSNTVSVKVKNLDKLGDVLTAASSAGANTAGGISFDVLDRTDAYNQALAQAMDKAHARAVLMAQACGVTLGQAFTINESSSYTGPVFAAASDSMTAGAKSIAAPTAAGQLDVTASVSVVYGIVK